MKINELYEAGKTKTTMNSTALANVAKSKWTTQGQKDRISQALNASDNLPQITLQATSKSTTITGPGGKGPWQSELKKLAEILPKRPKAVQSSLDEIEDIVSFYNLTVTWKTMTWVLTQTGRTVGAHVMVEGILSNGEPIAYLYHQGLTSASTGRRLIVNGKAKQLERQFLDFKQPEKPSSTAELKTWIKKLGLEDTATINPDGTVDVDGSVDLGQVKGEIPFQFGVVTQSFNIGDHITSLKNSPRVIGKTLSIGKGLESFDHMPEKVHWITIMGNTKLEPKDFKQVLLSGVDGIGMGGKTNPKIDGGSKSKIYPRFLSILHAFFSLAEEEKKSVIFDMFKYLKTAQEIGTFDSTGHTSALDELPTIIRQKFF